MASNAKNIAFLFGIALFSMNNVINASSNDSVDDDVGGLCYFFSFLFMLSCFIFRVLYNEIDACVRSETAQKQCFKHAKKTRVNKKFIISTP